MTTPIDPVDGGGDPCNIIIEVEHANGCAAVDLQLYLYVLGLILFFGGINLQRKGPSCQRSVMMFMVRLLSFLTVLSIAYQLNFLAMIDPQEPA